jgi:hypothetical protein
MERWVPPWREVRAIMRWSLLKPACEQTCNASAEGRSLAGFETGTVSRKLSKINIRLSLTIGSHEGIHNSLVSKKILRGGHDS